jgi:hypothetical protein
MILTTEIDKAISKHALWKMHLRTAIDTGKSDWNPETVRQDDLCNFGKWLYALSDSEKASPDWISVRARHTNFHSIAAKVLQLALTGQKEAAEEALTGNRSEFKQASAKLTNAMVGWKMKLAPEP